jgi:hypothetical protein
VQCDKNKLIYEKCGDVSTDKVHCQNSSPMSLFTEARPRFKPRPRELSDPNTHLENSPNEANALHMFRQGGES